MKKSRMYKILVGVYSLIGLFFLFGNGETAHASQANYNIYVNTTMNTVVVMEPMPDGTSRVVKTMLCSVGKVGNETPEGVFTTSNYYDWRVLVDGSYGRYAVRFNGPILFHSVPYEKRAIDSLKWDQYNMLGQGASLGCVRLTLSDAKWIYDNCKVGTTVAVYSGANIEGNVTFPSTLKIDGNLPYRNWDPTDTDIYNPWLNTNLPVPVLVGPMTSFDHIGYADRYTDLKEVYGYDQVGLYNHYISFGILENRIADFT